MERLGKPASYGPRSEACVQKQIGRHAIAMTEDNYGHGISE
jgi:hypothetical protein